MEAAKPWETELNYLKWIDPDTGYQCMIRRSDLTGTLCGYVRVPRGHQFYRRRVSKAERVISVHGGVTFSGKPMRYAGGDLRGHWFGFDCARAWDYMPAIPALSFLENSHVSYRDITYVKAEVGLMAQQLKRLS